MASITEDYVSFEIAKLLKEKGFDKYPLFPCYKEDNGEFINIPTTLDTINYCFIPAPTIQMAMKWLREVHNIAINIGWGEIFEDKFQWWCIILNQKDGSILRDSEYYATREEACEDAIKYCIERLI